VIDNLYLYDLPMVWRDGLVKGGPYIAKKNLKRALTSVLSVQTRSGCGILYKLSEGKAEPRPEIWFKSNIGLFLVLC
jgi:hypothetical protein